MHRDIAYVAYTVRDIAQMYSQGYYIAYAHTGIW